MGGGPTGALAFLFPQVLQEGLVLAVEVRPDANICAIWWPKDQPLAEEYIRLFRGHRGILVILRRRVVERTFA